MRIPLLFLGLLLLLTGIYVSTFLTIAWVIVGTFMAVIGGGLTGMTTCSLVSNKKY